MIDVVIIDAVRTAVGRRNGALANEHPVDLSAFILSALIERTGFQPGDVDDVVWGCVNQVGEQGLNVGRSAVLAAGWPESVPGVTVDRQCGSSQQAVHFAAAMVASGQADVVVAGGVESMTRVPLGSSRRNGPGDPYGPRALARYGVDGFSQGEAAEMLADQWSLTRSELDEYALASHAKAAAAWDAGRFDGQIAPVKVVAPGGASFSFDRDEGVRRDTSLERLAELETVFRADGRIHAGNASQISDGASALLIMSGEAATRRGLRPLARLHSHSVVGVDPVSMLTGPIPATARVLRRAGLKLDDIGAFEINEAFASVTVAWLKETGAETHRLNPNGGAIALGHPLGASGARLMTTLVHHLHNEGIRYGLQAMCEGGGMANATILERLS